MKQSRDKLEEDQGEHVLSLEKATQMQRALGLEVNPKPQTLNHSRYRVDTHTHIHTHTYTHTHIHTYTHTHTQTYTHTHMQTHIYTHTVGGGAEGGTYI